MFPGEHSTPIHQPACDGKAQQWGAALWMLEEPSMKSAERLQAAGSSDEVSPGRVDEYSQGIIPQNPREIPRIFRGSRGVHEGHD